MVRAWKQAGAGRGEGPSVAPAGEVKRKAQAAGSAPVARTRRKRDRHQPEVLYSLNILSLSCLILFIAKEGGEPQSVPDGSIAPPLHGFRTTAGAKAFARLLFCAALCAESLPRRGRGEGGGLGSLHNGFSSDHPLRAAKHQASISHPDLVAGAQPGGHGNELPVHQRAVAAALIDDLVCVPGTLDECVPAGDLLIIQRDVSVPVPPQRGTVVYGVTPAGVQAMGHL